MTSFPPRDDQLRRLGDEDDLDPASPVQVFTDDGVEHRIVTAESSPTGAVAMHVEPTPQTSPKATLASRILGNTLNAAIRRWLARYSIALLRISMGAMIFGFGILKYFPGVSPAEDLVLATTDLLTFGLVPGRVALVLFATVECAIGLSLVTGWGLRLSIYPLALWVVGILSPVVLLPERLFSGPYHAPTLEGQYVLKDVILLTATLAIAIRPRRRYKRHGNKSAA
ncbi:MAG: hypothetical protein LC808_01940 [Actinobacteria bacterium]|nr:hypothetical protein [Actinomycetota bacterium]